MHAGDHDEDETLHCYRHPDRETALQCLTCDRPICVDCANHGPVGIKCPECSRTSRAARGVIPTTRLVRGLLAGTVVALVLGVVFSILNLPFIGIIVAWFCGIAIGETTRRASGGFRDPVLARGAAVAAAVGFGALPLISLIAVGRIGSGIVWALIAAAVAAYSAYQRAH